MTAKTKRIIGIAGLTTLAAACYFGVAFVSGWQVANAVVMLTGLAFAIAGLAVLFCEMIDGD